LNKLKKIWKKVVAVYFEVKPWLLPEQTEESRPFHVKSTQFRGKMFMTTSDSNKICTLIGSP
jgi:hypothetical protein